MSVRSLIVLSVAIIAAMLQLVSFPGPISELVLVGSGLLSVLVASAAYVFSRGGNGETTTAGGGLS